MLRRLPVSTTRCLLGAHVHVALASGFIVLLMAGLGGCGRIGIETLGILPSELPAEVLS